MCGEKKKKKLIEEPNRRGEMTVEFDENGKRIFEGVRAKSVVTFPYLFLTLRILPRIETKYNDKIYFARYNVVDMERSVAENWKFLKVTNDTTDKLQLI